MLLVLDLYFQYPRERPGRSRHAYSDIRCRRRELVGGKGGKAREENKRRERERARIHER